MAWMPCSKYFKEEFQMRINHNTSALNTYRQLNANNSASAKSLEKLSSGLNINRAADNAAGLAISEKMRGQIRGLDQAGKNAQDGISLIQTAEGGLNETASILQRMRELAVQSANDTNTSSDRSQMQKELDQLSTEITRISTDTEFNSKKLLNGAMGKTFAVTANTFTPQGVAITGTDITTGTYTLTKTAAGTDTYTQNTNTAATGFVAGDVSAASGNKYGNYSLQVSNFAGTADLQLTGPDGTVTTKTGQALGAANTIGGITFSFNTHAITSNGTIAFSLTDNNLDVDLSGAKTVNASAIAAYAGQTLNVGGFSFNVLVGSGAGGTVNTMNVTDNAIKFQIGANQDQNTKLAVNDMSATALGVNALDITTQNGANLAITTIDAAVTSVSTERANLGAMQNRLDHTINSLGTTSENLTASESQIRDVDMAKEMMEYTKNSILSQAATAMLAQANQAPQEVLQLLK
jgi:flagellin